MGKHEESQLKERSTLEPVLTSRVKTNKGGTKMTHCDSSFLVHYEIKYTRKV
jgi:hypothetical protein